MSMAKSKADLLAEAQQAGLVADDADADAFTVDQLRDLLSGEVKATDRKSATEPIVAPDGHVVLSQEDIDARDAQR
jgi:hypothetical protein